MAVKMSREIDFDLYFLMALPGIIGLSAFWLDHQAFFLAVQLGLAVAFYELSLFGKRRIYGLNGLRILSFASLMFLSYTLLIAIPAIYIFTVKEVSARYDFWYAVLSFYLFMPAAFYLSNLLWPLDSEKIPRLYKPGLESIDGDERIYEFLIILLGLSFLTMVDYILRVDVIPLFELISNPNAYMDAFMMREESKKLLEVSFLERYMFSWLIELFFPLGISGSAFLAYKFRGKKYIRLFIAFLGLGLFNNSLTIAKAPTAALLLIVLSFYFLKQQKISLRFLLVSLVLIFAFPFFVIYFVSVPEIRHFDNLIINGLLYRIFIVPADVLYQFFRIFPEFHDFLGGRSSNIFSWLHPAGNFKTANYIAQIWWRDPFTTGSGNAVYLGNFWADFAWPGIIASTIFLGGMSHYLFYKVLHLADYRKSGLYFMFVCSLVPLYSFYFISVSFTVFFLTKGLVLVFLLIFLFKYLKFIDNGRLNAGRN